MIDPVSVFLSSTNDWLSQCILEFYKWLTQSVYTWVLQMIDPVNVYLSSTNDHWLGQSFVELKYTLTESVICRTQVYTDWVNHL
jgi:hypothetical protein